MALCTDIQNADYKTAYVRARMRACVRARVRACVRASVIHFLMPFTM